LSIIQKIRLIHLKMRNTIVLALGLLISTAAWSQPDPVADSLARQVFDSAGGAEIWSSVPYVLFSQATEINRIPNRVIRHLWNRKTNQYRMELPGPAGQPYVVLFDLDTRQGKAYWNADELESNEASDWVEKAYRRFVNDSFWFLAPMMLFDSGVERTFLPDSSNETEGFLHLRFTLPDRAPAKEFYLQIDRSLGRITQWKYRAPADAPNGPFRIFEWRDYGQYTTPGGDLILSARKRSLGKPYEVVTKSIQFPPEVPDAWFTDGSVILTPTPEEPQ